MSKLNVDQRTIKSLFSDKKSDFLIPDYQRPYAWEEEQCQTLWDDIFTFAIPDNDYQKFNENEEYFLGSIVTFTNENKKLEVIDGQQRLTTLMLLLRAFYGRFENMKDSNSLSVKEMISQCIWKTDEFGKANLNELKINSEVATDNDKSEFLDILKTGIADKSKKSNYANNFRFFQTKIDNFLAAYPSYFPYLPTRILNNCILLPIEAESQDTALRIFSTLNDRGLPLSDADIFKSKFYKFYGDKGNKSDFIARWKKLEDRCEKIFHPMTGTPMDELFTRYMYYERAKQGNKSTTTEALRKFYEKDKYALLKKDETLVNLEILAEFWNDVANQNPDCFSDQILKQLFVLNYAPNGMWAYFVSVYFMHNKNSDNKLDESNFSEFLSKTIAFVWAYAITNPGVNALRTPIFAEMINIVNNNSVEFTGFKFTDKKIKDSFNNYEFTNNRPITKSVLTWWAFNNAEQVLPKIEDKFQIEHIFAKKRQENDNLLTNIRNLESLGNKSLLEDKINIRASDYKFSDKVKIYNGYVDSKGKVKGGTIISDLKKLAQQLDFIETDIEIRTNMIVDGFINFLKANNLLQSGEI